MQLMPSLQVKQKQSLVMTPQLQQAIKLLQMTNLDIAAFLQEQALDNPFIEFDPENQTPDAFGVSSSGQIEDDRGGRTDAVNENSSLDRDMTEGAAIADDRPPTPMLKTDMSLQRWIMAVNSAAVQLIPTGTHLPILLRPVRKALWSLCCARLI